jgi:hypothetical protein
VSPNSARAFGVQPSGNSQPDGRKRNRVYAKRVPSYLTPDRQRDAVRSVRAGRAVHHVAQEFGVAESVILELCQRDLERRVRDLMGDLAARLDEIDADLRGKRPAARGAAA